MIGSLVTFFTVAGVAWTAIALFAGCLLLWVGCRGEPELGEGDGELVRLADYRDNGTGKAA